MLTDAEELAELGVPLEDARRICSVFQPPAAGPGADAMLPGLSAEQLGW